MAYMKDKAGRRLDSFQVAPQAANTIILLGDSITAYDSVNLLPDYSKGTASAGYFAQANVMLGHPLEPIYNAGVSGNNTGGILARVQADVIDRKPGWCSVLAGTNDVSQGIPTATAIANLKEIYSRIIGAGIRLVVCTVPPTQNAEALASKRNTMHDINTFIRYYAANTPGVILVDWFSRLVNPATGTPITALFQDGTHPYHSAAYRMGKVWADAVRPHLTINPRLLSAPNEVANLVGNYGMMTGTAGVIKAGSGGTGTVADGWTVESLTPPGAYTVSTVPRSGNVAGNWQQIKATAGNTAGFSLWKAASFAGLVPGDVLDLTCEFEADQDWAQITGGGVELLLQVLSGSPTITAYDLQSGGNAPDFIPTSGVLRATCVVPPTAITGIFVKAQFRVGAAGTVRFGGFDLRKRPVY